MFWGLSSFLLFWNLRNLLYLIGVDLDTIWKDAVNKYIMGEIDVDGYNAEIERWYSEGGADVASEYAECYRIAQDA